MIAKDACACLLGVSVDGFGSGAHFWMACLMTHPLLLCLQFWWWLTVIGNKVFYLSLSLSHGNWL